MGARHHADVFGLSLARKIHNSRGGFSVYSEDRYDSPGHPFMVGVGVKTTEKADFYLQRNLRVVTLGP